MSVSVIVDISRMLNARSMKFSKKFSNILKAAKFGIRKVDLLKICELQAKIPALLPLADLTELYSQQDIL